MKLIVGDILMPKEDGLPPFPSVRPTDRLTMAIRLMLENEVGRIAVVLNRQQIGTVYLDDAIRGLGLRLQTKLSPDN